jgi:hypothetical protein
VHQHKEDLGAVAVSNILQALSRCLGRRITGIPDDIRAALELVEDPCDMVRAEPLQETTAIVQPGTFVNDVVERTSQSLEAGIETPQFPD